MCPIVPIFKCGLLRSNFSFAIVSRPHKRGLELLSPNTENIWSGGPDLNRQPSPWKSETLPLSYPRPRFKLELTADHLLKLPPQNSWSLGPGLNRWPRPYQ